MPAEHPAIEMHDLPGLGGIRAEARHHIGVAAFRHEADILAVRLLGDGEAQPDAAEPGEIVHLDGRVLGRHQGIARYTVGQGRGLGQASRDGEEPLFVTGVEARTRRVVVGPRQALPQAVVEVGEVNWLAPPPAAPLRCQVKLRARELPRDAEIAWDAAAGLLRVTPDEAAIAAPGQACVLYAGERVLGGGFIRRAMGAVAAA